jgi:hypothetical protein
MEGVNSSKIYLRFCMNFCKCHNVPPLSTIKKLKYKKQMSQDFLFLDSQKYTNKDHSWLEFKIL